MSNSKNIDIGKNVIDIESKAVAAIADKIGKSFENAVNSILNCNGRLIILGMGKSGLISQKIAATMSSTGTPSHFVHPADAFHGDLGMITKNDIVLMISNSGETHELLQIIPALKKKKITTIGMFGKENSTLFNSVDHALDTSVEKEACPLDLTPTASTTAALAMGDALAVALLENRGFDAKDFAELNPGGSLGKKLLLNVDQLVHKGEDIPFVKDYTSLKDSLLTISEKGLGITGVLDENNTLIGIITDGDIRRGVEQNGNNIFDKTAKDFMSADPKVISSDTLAITALELMEEYNITSLFVYSSENLKKPDGVIHIHDILKAGIK